MSDEHLFTIAVTWNTVEKSGTLKNADGTFAVPHRGAPSLGGISGAANPEELLTAAVSACFIQTWAIFVEKLKLPLDALALDSHCTVEKDPAGGFHVTRIELHPHVPAGLYESRRADVEKSLSLAEKYCIVSKAVRGDGSVLEVEPRAL